MSRDDDDDYIPDKDVMNTGSRKRKYFSRHCKTKSKPESIICICGTTIKLISPQNIYGPGQAAVCDGKGCENQIVETEVYHCDNKHFHNIELYDLCVKCGNNGKNTFEPPPKRRKLNDETTTVLSDHESDDDIIPEIDKMLNANSNIEQSDNMYDNEEEKRIVALPEDMYDTETETVTKKHKKDRKKKKKHKKKRKKKKTHLVRSPDMDKYDDVIEKLANFHIDKLREMGIKNNVNGIYNMKKSKLIHKITDGIVYGSLPECPQCQSNVKLKVKYLQLFGHNGQGEWTCGGGWGENGYKICDYSSTNEVRNAWIELEE
eukprot:386208_1